MRVYIEFKLDGSPPMTRVQFSKAFLGKYIPYNIREGLKDEYFMFDQGSITIFEYVDRFYELSRHVTMILPIKYERVYCFIRGLRL